MKLTDIPARKSPPEPWSEGDNIPWNEPGFSRRMLREHLSQSHDLASRRSDKIDAHVGWIHREALCGSPTCSWLLRESHPKKVPSPTGRGDFMPTRADAYSCILPGVSSSINSM